MYKHNPTIKYFAYLWLQFKESLLLLTALHTYLRYLFVTRYNLLVFLHGLFYKGLLFVGIILRIIGEFKRISRKNNRI